MTSPNTITPSDQASGIFINYRRDDTAGHAGRLHDVLNNRFRSRVFMDIDKIEAGQDFVDAIDEAVGGCRVLLVLIGKQWLSVADSAGRRRLDNPEDFVRREIASALTRGVAVVPVLVEGAGMPRQEDLPEELKKLSRHNAIELSDTRWAYDVERLVKLLEKHVGACETETAIDATTGGLGNQTKKTGANRTKIALVAGVAVLAAIGLTVGFLLFGRNTKSPQANAPGVAAQSVPSEAELREINQALELIGRCLSLTDGVQVRLTSSAYDPATFNDKKIKETLDKDFVDAVNKFNQAEEDWKSEQPRLELLMNRHPAVNASWRSAQQAVTAYMDCVTALYNTLQSTEEEPVAGFQKCESEQASAKKNVTLLTTSIAEARR